MKGKWGGEIYDPFLERNVCFLSFKIMSNHFTSILGNHQIASFPPPLLYIGGGEKSVAKGKRNGKDKSIGRKTEWEGVKRGEGKKDRKEKRMGRRNIMKFTKKSEKNLFCP